MLVVGSVAVMRAVMMAHALGVVDVTAVDALLKPLCFRRRDYVPGTRPAAFAPGRLVPA
ncbi:hypothetical protein DYI95_007835 [Thermaerobacter sp. PB12/4term]|uniref:hypothetical protein n=1 Tax=Thermaerobacter sp. PB12/4term TaxID=2293838 RepID=UPI001314DF27|nr:hypothetical protein [Thermaerobacter sp. PB12/4term]QIA27445.1 hypothetical protein DYI95_007835 [Thermaerobacter sp. PB12/4term]